MKRKLMALCFTLACSLALIYAQDDASKQQSTTREHQQASGKEMRLTGCLSAGTEPNTYVLNNVSSNTAKSKKGKNPTEMARAQEFVLIPGPNVELKDHVGHKIEVRGTLENNGMKGGSTDENKSSSSASSSTSQPSMAQFKVSQVKHISPTCP